jgi:hypothetical protein
MAALCRVLIAITQTKLQITITAAPLPNHILTNPSAISVHLFSHPAIHITACQFRITNPSHPSKHHNNTITNPIKSPNLQKSQIQQPILSLSSDPSSNPGLSSLPNSAVAPHHHACTAAKSTTEPRLDLSCCSAQLHHRAA